MKNLFLKLALILLICSCSKQEINNKKKYKRFFLIDSVSQVSQQYGVIKREIYVSGLDTILNQLKIINNKKIDSAVSHFYNLKIEKLDLNTNKAYLKYFSPVPLFNKDSITLIESYFTYLDLIKDSLIVMEIPILPNQEIVFEYNFGEKNKGLIGMIFELHTKKLSENDSIEIIKSRLFVDVEPLTPNLFIDIYK